MNGGRGDSCSTRIRLAGARRLDEYHPRGGIECFGGRFTGTPNAGFELSDGRARDDRIGWRLTSAVPSGPGFEVRFDATRREPPSGNAPPEHERGEARTNEGAGRNQAGESHSSRGAQAGKGQPAGAASIGADRCRHGRFTGRLTPDYARDYGTQCVARRARDSTPISFLCRSVALSIRV